MGNHAWVQRAHAHGQRVANHVWAQRAQGWGWAQKPLRLALVNTEKRRNGWEAEGCSGRMRMGRGIANRAGA